MISLIYFIPILRFIIAATVLLIVGFLVPGFKIHGFFTAVLTSALISAIGWILEAFMGGFSPYGRGLTGFISTASVIYIVKFIITGVKVTVIGALLTALIIGIIDLFLPPKVRFRTEEY